MSRSVDTQIGECPKKQRLKKPNVQYANHVVPAVA